MGLSKSVVDDQQGKAEGKSEGSERQFNAEELKSLFKVMGVDRGRRQQ